MPLHACHANSFCSRAPAHKLAVCLGKRLWQFQIHNKETMRHRDVKIAEGSHFLACFFPTAASKHIQAASKRVRRSGSWHRGPMCPSQRNSLVRKAWFIDAHLENLHILHPRMVNLNRLSTQLMVDHPSDKHSPETINEGMNLVVSSISSILGWYGMVYETNWWNFLRLLLQLKTKTMPQISVETMNTNIARENRIASS